MARTQFALTFSALLIAVGSCFGAVNLPVGQSAYIVASPKSQLEKRTVDQLTNYLTAVLHKEPRVVSDLRFVPSSTSAIMLARTSEVNPLGASAPAGAPEGFALVSGKSAQRSVVVVVGNTDRGWKRGIQKLILKSRQTEGGLEIPELNLSAKPWIPEREWALCPWVPRYVRGAYVNPYADERLDILVYGDAQLARYVEMLDWFGFSGVQLMGGPYSYGIFGSVEACQEKLKTLALLARENGQQVSLWVWAAEFSSYGWVDPDVTYTPSPGLSAFDDPKVRKGFEKYYDYYAELAPYVDRLFGHFYDPGRLENRQDVFNYMRLLESKFKAKNPRIKLGIDLWAVSGTEYFDELVKNGFKDYLFLESSIPLFLSPPQRAQIHEDAKRLGLRLGMWAWYDTEYETDQHAAMYVNGHVLKEFVQEVKDGAARIYPLQYWSSMDAHHINNMCSLYLSGQLLWNPDRDPEEIMTEFAEGIWGPRNGPKILEALKLIQDVRSGPNWNTFMWTEPGYRRGTADPKEDLRRAESALTELKSLKKDEQFVPKFPLPVPPDTLVELMLPHLKQIRAFAEFRIELDQIRASWKGGASKEEISRQLAKAWKPIPEYNTWVGTFGQTEGRMQEILLRKLANEAGVCLTEPAWLRARDVDRLLQKIQNEQRSQRGEFLFKISQLNEFFWTKEKLDDRFEKLIADGWVEKVQAVPDGGYYAGQDTYRLVNWQEYAP